MSVLPIGCRPIVCQPMDMELAANFCDLKFDEIIFCSFLFQMSFDNSSILVFGGVPFHRSTFSSKRLFIKWIFHQMHNFI